MFLESLLRSGVCGDPKVANPTHVLFGPTCDGFDTIMNGVTHLPEMEIGIVV